MQFVSKHLKLCGFKSLPVAISRMMSPSIEPNVWSAVLRSTISKETDPETQRPCVIQEIDQTALSFFE